MAAALRAQSPTPRARPAFVRFADGKTKEFQHPRSVEGLAFSPKGMRFGVAR